MKTVVFELSDFKKRFKVYHVWQETVENYEFNQEFKEWMYVAKDTADYWELDTFDYSELYHYGEKKKDGLYGMYAGEIK